MAGLGEGRVGTYSHVEPPTRNELGRYFEYTTPPDKSSVIRPYVEMLLAEAVSVERSSLEFSCSGFGWVFQVMRTSLFSEVENFEQTTAPFGQSL